MKIKLPSTSVPANAPRLADVAKTPMAPTSVPIPYPNVAAGGSSFSGPQGIERRFSVQFMSSIEGKLKLAGLGDDFAKSMKAQLSTLDRSGIDREGRVIDSILQSSHPKEGMQLYDRTARLLAMVTPGGFRAEANAMGSWTVRPPGADPFELKPGQSKQLPDGTKLKASAQQLEASGAFKAKLSAAGAQLGKLVDPSTVAVALSDAFQSRTAKALGAKAHEIAQHVVRNAMQDGKLTKTEVKSLKEAQAKLGGLSAELQKLKANDARLDSSDRLVTTSDGALESMIAHAARLAMKDSKEDLKATKERLGALEHQQSGASGGAKGESPAWFKFGCEAVSLSLGVLGAVGGAATSASPVTGGLGVMNGLVAGAGSLVNLGLTIGEAATQKDLVQTMNDYQRFETQLTKLDRKVAAMSEEVGKQQENEAAERGRAGSEAEVRGKILENLQATAGALAELREAVTSSGGGTSGAKSSNGPSPGAQTLERALETVMGAPPDVQKILIGLLEQTGKSAAPSSRADTAAEKAALLEMYALRQDQLHGKAKDALADLKDVAQRIRGAAREVVLGTLG